MGMKVLKFGGSSLADAEQFRKAAAIICAEPERRYVVVSAPGKRFSADIKITDLLYQCFDLAASGKNIGSLFAKIRKRCCDIAAELGLTLSLDKELQHIQDAIQNHASRDYAASRGEYLSARILSAYLEVPFVDADSVIFFHDNGKLDTEKTNEALAQALSGLPRAVIPGFYGARPDGSIQTFSRGGSDITGALVARAVHASVYENWTDVSGIFMADPRIVKHPRCIPEISYEEVERLASMGAAVLHDEAVFPVREAHIPVNIRNTNAPEAPGTMIVDRVDDSPRTSMITGVAGRTGFSTIVIEKIPLHHKSRFQRSVLAILEQAGLSFEQVYIDGNRFSVVLSTAAIEPCRDHIMHCILQDTQADTVTIVDGIALLGVVGQRMEHAAHRLTNAVNAQNFDFCMVNNNSSENMLVSVRESDYVRAFRAIYREAVRC